MQTQIKICEIASLAEARLAMDAGADALGFVCARPKSPRTIDERLVAEIAPRIPQTITTYLLTSELTARGIVDHVERTGTSAVQILAPINAEESRLLPRLLPGIRLVQVIHVEDESALEHIERYAPDVDAFLLDSGKPMSPTPEYGGTGRTHDWSVSAEFVRRSPLPVALAGGLTPVNVREAIESVRPHSVDVYSGVRTLGALDQEKLSEFVHAVRSAEEM
ncbi:MAG: phosphoribosylanthranilate isomerase [Verrucomicrobiae bacterium]|nr:phosphoribosylanthranilate isomerase [Verrucomicrobiae bacterium]